MKIIICVIFLLLILLVIYFCKKEKFSYNVSRETIYQAINSIKNDRLARGQLQVLHSNNYDCEKINSLAGKKYNLDRLVQQGKLVGYLIRLPIVDVDGEISIFRALLDTTDFRLLLFTDKSKQRAYADSSIQINKFPQSNVYPGTEQIIVMGKNKIHGEYYRCKIGCPDVDVAVFGVSDITRGNGLDRVLTCGLLPLPFSYDNPQNIPSFLELLSPMRAFMIDFSEPGREYIEFDIADRNPNSRVLELIDRKLVPDLFSSPLDYGYTESFYIVKVKSVSYTTGGETVQINPSPSFTIIDTGTACACVMANSPFSSSSPPSTITVILETKTGVITLMYHSSDPSVDGIIASDSFSNTPNLMLIGVNLLVGRIMSIDCKTRTVTLR